jgi:phosphate transport system permease protein
LGVLAAVFLVENRRSRLAPPVRFIGELLGGVPSIVLGIMGYGLLARPPEWLGWSGTGFSGWAGAFTLAVMMIPIVMRSAEEAMKLVPQSLRNASYALGAAYWQTITRVTIPAALPAIVTGVFLAMARIAGETAPLLLTVSSNDRWTWWPGEPMPYLTYWIYFGSRDPLPEQQRLAWAAAVVLLLVVMLLNVSIRLATGRRQVAAGGVD